MPCFSCVVKEEDVNSLRLDRYVSEVLHLFSRSQIKAKKLSAKINGKNTKLSKLVKPGDTLDMIWDDAVSENIIAQDIALEIIYEDERCVVINKAGGMVVHPGAGNRTDTLANALCFRNARKNITPVENGSLQAGLRPFIVHRLDKDTSGVIIAAYDDEAHNFLSRQFKLRNVKKNYVAIVCGVPKEKKGRIETFIARDPKDRKCFTVAAKGKISLTFYKVIKSWQNYSLVLLRPITGRTHQLRVHLRYIGNPILGDSVYGRKDSFFPQPGLMLHSKSLEILLPGETAKSFFSSPIPERFNYVFEKLNFQPLHA